MSRQLMIFLLLNIAIVVHAVNPNEDFTNPAQWRPKVKLAEADSSGLNSVESKAVKHRSLSETFTFKTPANLSKDMILPFLCKYESEKDIVLRFNYVYLTDTANKNLTLNLRGRKQIFKTWAFYVFYLSSCSKIDAGFDYSAVKSITFYAYRQSKTKADYKLFLSLRPLSSLENLSFPLNNLIFNGDFKLETEQGRIPGWSASFWTKAKGKVTQGQDHVMKWENPHGSSGQIYSMPFPVKPDSVLRLKASFKANDNKKMRCSIRWMDADFKTLKNKSGRRIMTSLDLLLPSGGKWVEDSKDFVVPKTARFGTLYILNTRPRSISYRNIEITPSSEKIEQIKSGKNLLKEGSSFEVGVDGFDVSGAAPLETFPAWKVSFDRSQKVHGRQSLKIAIPKRPENHGEFLCHLGYPVLPIFEEGERYTISYYLKSEPPMGALSLTMGYGSGLKRTARGKEPGPNGWTRYYSTFEIPPGLYKKRYFFWLKFGVSRQVDGSVYTAPQNLWIDAVQVEKGGLTAYKPSAATQLSMRTLPTEKRGIFYLGKEKILLQAISSGKNLKNAKLEYKLTDLYDDHLVSKGTFEGLGNSDGQTKFELSVPNPGRGCYYVQADLKSASGKLLATEEAVFAVITKAENLKSEPDSFFGIHPFHMLTTQRGGLVLPKSGPCNCYMRGNDSPEFYVRLSRDIGARWIRSFKFGYGWKYVNYAPGKFRWAYDKITALTRKYGMNTLGIIWGAGGQGYRLVPDWAIERRLQSGFPIPKDAAWRNYVKGIVSHYRGKVNAWEIMNEPNSGLGGKNAKTYIELLKSASEEVRKADPDSKVLAICGTSDYGDPVGWMRSCLELGALKYLDVISAHLYGSVRKLESLSAKVNKLIDSMDKAAGKSRTPFWNTESGSYGPKPRKKLLAGRPPRTIAEVAHQSLAVDNLIKKMVFARTDGNEKKHFPFVLKASMSNIFHPDPLSTLSYDNTPSPRLVAYDMLADMVSSTKKWQRIRWGGDIYCYLFKRQGMCPLAIIWNNSFDQESYDCVLPFAPGSLKLMSATGRHLKIDGAKEGSLLKITASPIYLEMPGENFDKAVNIFNKVKIANASLWRVRTPYLGVNQKGTPQLSFNVQSLHTDKLPVELKLKSFPSFMDFRRKSISANLSNNKKSIILNMPCAFNKNKIGSQAVFKAEITGKGKSSTIDSRYYFIPAFESLKTIKVDASLDAWNDKGWRIINDRYHIVSGAMDAFHGAKDLTVSLATRWNGDTLYVAAKVKDDVVIVPPRDTKKQYLYDAVELFFNFNLAADNLKNAPKFIRPELQLVISPREGKKGKAMVTAYRDARPVDKYIKAAYALTKDGYIIEMAIDLKYFKIKPETTSMIGFEFGADDVDKKYDKPMRDFQTIWSLDDKRPAYSASKYGRMIFRRK